MCDSVATIKLKQDKKITLFVLFINKTETIPLRSLLCKNGITYILVTINLINRLQV